MLVCVVGLRAEARGSSESMGFRMGTRCNSASSGVPSAAQLDVNTNCSLTFADSQHDISPGAAGCRRAAITHRVEGYSPV